MEFDTISGEGRWSALIYGATLLLGTAGAIAQPPEPSAHEIVHASFCPAPAEAGQAGHLQPVSAPQAARP